MRAGTADGGRQYSDTAVSLQVRAVEAGGRARTAGRLWRLADGEKLLELAGHTGELIAAEWGPDDQLALTAATDGRANIWDARDGSLLWRLDHEGQQVFTASFSSDGRRVVTGTADGRVTVWDLEPVVPPAELERVMRCRVPYEVEREQLVQRELDPTDCARPAAR